jgi:peptide/nickel transport system permease protein/oligopeptide transport system permease protein
MFKYFLKRFGLMIITFLISVFLFFLFIKLMPDYHKALPGEEDLYYKILYEREGWGKPIPEQFFIWVKNIFKDGSFGYSNFWKMDSSLVYFRKIPATIIFQLVPYILSTILGIGLGILAALRKNKATDHVISVGVMVLISVPSFVVAVLGQYFLVWRWKIFPQQWVATSSEIEMYGFSWVLKTYALPTIIMTVTGLAGWARSIRAELTEQLTQDYMLLARSKGLSHAQATVRHALKNSLVPFAPSIFLGFVGLLSGSMVMERLFRVDGTANIYLTAFSNLDYPVLLLIVVFTNFLGFLLAILGEMSYTLMDPRMRGGSGK